MPVLFTLNRNLASTFISAHTKGCIADNALSSKMLMWVCLLGILMLQSLTKIHNWAKKCSLKGKQTNRALCQCARKKKDLFWWTAAWEMCTVWFVLQGSLLVNYKTMVMFCCTALPSSSTKFFVWVCFQFKKPEVVKLASPFPPPPYSLPHEKYNTGYFWFCISMPL